MAIRRMSKSLLSQSGQDRVSNFIAGYSPAVDEIDLIQTTTVGATPASVINFTNIPQTYKHLQIRGYIITSGVGGNGYAYAQLRFAPLSTGIIDAGTNYCWYEMFAQCGTSTSITNISSLLSSTAAIGFEAGYPSPSIAPGVIDIFDYTSTNIYKTVKSITGGENTSSNSYVLWAASTWLNTSAITSIQLTPTSGSFAQYSKISLYGVK